MIHSLLDTDLYKLTMQQAVLECYPNAVAEYRFTNRNTNHQFNPSFVERLKEGISKMGSLCLQVNEATYLTGLGLFKPAYIEYLKNYRFDPSQIIVRNVQNNSQMSLEIWGPWHQTILWEVPLMAMISELYFEDSEISIEEENKRGNIYNHAMRKAKTLGLARHRPSLSPCLFAEFGTRRRRSRIVQEIVLKALIDSSSTCFNNWTANHLVGTSNVELAMSNRIRPIGTMAHEWVMGVSALESLRYANRFALHRWKDVYRANLGIALTDTFGTSSFFKDFDLELAKVYDGVRHDSGDPIAFGENVISHYRDLGIDPTSKTIIFSDGLNVEKAIDIHKAFYNRIKVSFGIGTHFTNDFEDEALNMVIKLRSINGIPVVKLSDEPGKETGDEKAIEVAKWTFA